MAARKKTVKKKTTRAKAPSKATKRVSTFKYKLEREEFLELRVANLELGTANQQVNQLVNQKLRPQVAAATAEARDEVKGWHEKSKALADIQEALQKKYGKKGYTLQNPDDDGAGVLTKD